MRQSTAASFGPLISLNVVLKIQKNGITHDIELRRDGAKAPPWRGSGERKLFGADESLEDAIILSRRARLWVEC